MPLTSPLVARERFLFYGEPGVGKSKAYLDIAKLLKVTRSPGTVRVIDNDKSVLRMSEGQSLDNVEVAEVYDWPEYISALKKFVKLSKPDDWLVADLMSEAWSAVQSFYTEQIYGDDMGEYFLQLRKKISDPKFEGWQDWGFINKCYFDFARPFVYRSPCHVIAVSTASKLDAKLDDKATVSVFGRVGYHPEGQKRLKHQFNTTVFFHKDARGGYRYTTLKDRERTLQISSELGDDEHPGSFARAYLLGVAGWTVK